jgi:hypothetical protein
MRYKIVNLVFFYLLVCMPLYAQYFIDSPSPGGMLQGDYLVSMRIGPEGSLLVRLSSAPFHGLSIGISYGGEKILGYEDPLFYKNPGIEARLLVMEEASLIPRIILGFDSQGYDWDGKDFRVRSKGIYGLLGKEMAIFQGGVGVNYNTEDGKTGFFSGALLNLSPTFSVVGDYSFYPDEENKGFLGLGTRINFEGVLLQFTFRDITGKKTGRALDLGYTGCF